MNHNVFTGTYNFLISWNKLLNSINTNLHSILSKIYFIRAKIQFILKHWLTFIYK